MLSAGNFTASFLEDKSGIQLQLFTRQRKSRVAHNVNGEWNFAKIIQKSINIGSKERRKEKLRKDTYHKNVKKGVREKKSKLSDKEEQDRGKTEDIIEGVLDHGLWEEREQIMTKMKNMSEKKKKRDALRKQFLLLTKILGCDFGGTPNNKDIN